MRQEKKDLKQAMAIYQDIYKYLDSEEFYYEKKDNGIEEFTMTSKDLDIRCRFKVADKLKVIQFLSPLPFTVPKDKRDMMAIAVSIVSSVLNDGSFDFNYKNGEICFRMTASYENSIIGKDCFDYMLYCSANTIDVYNDKLLLISLGKMTIPELVDFIYSEE